jgi:predicted nucleic acid-binding protein
MSGTIDYLLDTNYVLAVVKQNPVVETDKTKLSNPTNRFAISAITWIELFSYPGITSEEEELIREALSGVKKIPLEESIQESTVQIRRERRLKLPDAIIVASALVCGAESWTLDERLRKVYKDLLESWNRIQPL